MTLDISSFFNTGLGMYVTQAFFHSLVAAAAADSAIVAWNVTSPLLRQRLRLITVFFPVLSVPAYHLFNPARGRISFRLEALFDSSGWLGLQPWGAVSLNILFAAVLSLAALVFVLQELAPVLKDALNREGDGAEREPGNVEFSASAREALGGLPFETPEISVISDEELVLFSTTGRNPTVFLSTGLVKSLDRDQLQAAVAHEFAHIKRSRRPMLMVAFLFRVVMFFNPVVLLEFRRIVQEEEKICDDVAVSATGKPEALAGTLQKFLHSPEGTEQRASGLGETLEQYSHDALLRSRIMRLERCTEDSHAGGGWFPFIPTVGMVIILCYFIV